MAKKGKERETEGGKQGEKKREKEKKKELVDKD